MIKRSVSWKAGMIIPKNVKQKTGGLSFTYFMIKTTMTSLENTCLDHEVQRLASFYVGYILIPQNYWDWTQRRIRRMAVAQAIGRESGRDAELWLKWESTSKRWVLYLYNSKLIQLGSFCWESIQWPIPKYSSWWLIMLSSEKCLIDKSWNNMSQRAE